MLYQIYSRKTTPNRLSFKIINIKHTLTNYIGYFLAFGFIDMHILIFEDV